MSGPNNSPPPTPGCQYLNPFKKCSGCYWWSYIWKVILCRCSPRLHSQSFTWPFHLRVSPSSFELCFFFLPLVLLFYFTYMWFQWFPQNKIKIQNFHWYLLIANTEIVYYVSLISFVETCIKWPSMTTTIIIMASFHFLV